MKGLKYLVKYSYRNLWRNPKRTLIMMISLCLGTSFIIWDLNLARSGSSEIVSKILRQYAGTQHISHPDYYDSENPREFNNYKVIKDDVILDPGVMKDSTARVTAPVYVSGSSKTLGVLLTGVDVEQEKKLTTFNSVITQGKPLTEDGEREIVLGKKVADRISVTIGDEVSVIGQALDGSVANELMRVVGIFDFGGGELEEVLAFTQIKSARELMAMEEGTYHQRVSFAQEFWPASTLKDAVVTPWNKLMPELGVSTRFIDGFTWIVSFIIVLVVSIGLANTLMITFIEREQEFQSLNVIGARASWIALSVMLEVFFLGTLGIVLGLLCGHLATMFFNLYPINIELFTGGKPIMMGGMVIQPEVRLTPHLRHYWQVPLLIYFFLMLSMIYPVLRVIRRSSHAL